MPNPLILRRRRLGRTSCREIANFSQTGIVGHRFDRPFPEGIDLVFRWGCTANVPVRNVVNTSAAIHQVNNKKEFRKILNEHELCPKTWFSSAHWGFQEDDDELSEHLPLIIRPARHAQGRNVYVCSTPEEFYTNWRIVYHSNPDHGYISELIDKVAEYRVCVVQGRVAWVAKKTPGNPQDVAWNVARGGRFDNVRWGDWPLKAVRYAVEAFCLSDLDFGGVDVMVDAEGNPYVIEINSAPSLTSPYRQECTAKCFDWIVRNGKDRIPLIDRKGGYRKFVHPAVCADAQIGG